MRDLKLKIRAGFRHKAATVCNQKTPNAQPAFAMATAGSRQTPMPSLNRQLAFGNWQWVTARGRIELPTNPECFRGCSIAVNGKSPAWDSSFASKSAQAGALHREWPFVS